MKRNPSLPLPSGLKTMRESLTWAPPPLPGIEVAAFVDNGDCDELALSEFLSEPERQKAYRLFDPAERRHFIVRRCFQRVFLKSVLNWPGSLPDLRIDHKLDTRSHCPEAPRVRLSFSSSGPTAIASGSANYEIGVDIEAMRSIADVDALAGRFFSLKEAESIRNLAGNAKSNGFLHLWTAKEAGLKAIGKGIESGLNSFEVSLNDDRYTVELNDDSATSRVWSLDYLRFLPRHVVALMHRPAEF